MTDPIEKETSLDSWRLIIDGPADGAWNMALDEAILAGYLAEGGVRPPTLRLYGWAPPTLSLGRSQEAASSCDRRFLHESGIGLVRRPTGGRAVLHDAERTYSVIGNLGRPPFEGGVLAVYRRIASALEAGLRGLGVEARAGDAVARGPSPRDPAAGPACFDAPSAHELLAGGRKVVGSAQLRRAGAFLQHGSILLDSDAERLACAVGARSVGDRFTDLARLLGRQVRPEEVDRALVDAWSERFGARLQRGEPSAAEKQLAARLRCWKYDSAAWTLHGRVGERERRWGPALSPARSRARDGRPRPSIR